MVSRTKVTSRKMVASRKKVASTANDGGLDGGDLIFLLLFFHFCLSHSVLFFTKFLDPFFLLAVVTAVVDVDDYVLNKICLFASASSSPLFFLLLLCFFFFFLLFLL